MSESKSPRPPATNASPLSSKFHFMARQAVSRAEANKPGNASFAEFERGKHFSIYAAEAVILAATSLEAGINEIADWYGLQQKDLLPDGFLEMKVRTKWSLLPRLVSGRTFDRGSQPWQEFHQLFALRDALIHFKWSSATPQFIKHLEAKDLALLDHNMPWTIAAQTNRTAEWAVQTAAEMFTTLTALLGRTGDDFFSWGLVFNPWDANRDQPCPASVHAPKEAPASKT